MTRLQRVLGGQRCDVMRCEGIRMPRKGEIGADNLCRFGDIMMGRLVSLLGVDRGSTQNDLTTGPVMTVEEMARY